MQFESFINSLYKEIDSEIDLMRQSFGSVNYTMEACFSDHHEIRGAQRIRNLINNFVSKYEYHSSTIKDAERH